MRQQRNTFQTKEQDKTPEKQLNEVEIDRQSIQERVQHNDRKDDPRTWEKNGCTEEKAIRSF